MRTDLKEFVTKKGFVFISGIVTGCLLFSCIFWLYGRTADQNAGSSQPGENENADAAESVVSESEKSIYLETYVRLLETSDDAFIDELNNNPIDQFYIDKYNAAETPVDESIVVGEWVSAYENELAAAYKQLDTICSNYLPEEDRDSIVSEQTKLSDTIQKGDAACSEYFSNNEYYIRGGGSTIQQDIAFYDLRRLRENLFNVAELINMETEYRFVFTGR